MDANIAHAELACPLDEGNPNVGTVELETAAARAPLRVALPGRDGIAVDRILHELERGHLLTGIRHHHGVEKEPMSALDAVDASSSESGLFSGNSGTNESTARSSQLAG